MGFLSSLAKQTGILNNQYTGAYASAKQQQKYALEQMAVNNKYQKEFAQNAHQWEVQDLEKAGLNPILSSGGGGASASGGGTASGATGTGTGGGFTDLANSAMQAAQTLSNLGLQESQKDKNQAETTGQTLQNELITPKGKAEIKQITTQSAVNEARKQEIKSNISLNSAKRIEALENAKFQKERARGYSVSKQQNRSGNTFLGGSSTGESMTKTW